MKKFIGLLLLFMAMMVAIDRGYGFVCEYLFNHATGGNTYIDKYVCDSMKSDVLVFGSSRARYHYNPDIISDSLGMSCYNCGEDGMGIIFHYARWKMISKRYLPKMIVYDVLPVLDEMVRDDNIIFVNQLRPFYFIHPEIDSVFWKIDPNERYKMLSKTYQYHSDLMNFVSDYRNGSHSLVSFTPKTGHVNPGQLAIEDNTNYEADSLKLYFLEKFINECQGKTKVVFCASPRYLFNHAGNAFEPIEALCKKYGIPFYNYYTDSRFVTNGDYFSDATHLSKLGADVYTRTVVSNLKKSLGK